MNGAGSENFLPPAGARVAVGMSGGVDSSMAAWLLKRRGCEVIGLTMSIWDGTIPLPGGGRSGCFGPGEEGRIAAARRMAERLGIAHHIIRLAPEYRHEVIGYFRRAYLAGRTPNPCARCNREIKCRQLPERARAEGLRFDFFATGHYVRRRDDPATGRCLLLQGRDASKDQSYFLALLDQEQLRSLVLPLGDMRKSEVRALARAAGFSELADGPESQDFVESNDYGWLFEKGELRPGDMVDLAGRWVGRHQGLARYTIGQRKGLGLGGAGEPWYVVALDAERNRVVVGRRQDLVRRRMRVGALNWMALSAAPATPMNILCRIRHRHSAAPGVLRLVSPEASELEVVFNEPQTAITPGQIAVFYKGDTILGAGEIVSAGPD
jgi:tRNA-specific 2-thiouridylase